MEDYRKLKMIETRSRSLMKSLAYRLISIVGTGLLTWAVTRDLREAASVTLVIQIFLIILYYTYERVWDRVEWGRKVQVVEHDANHSTD